MHHSGHSRSYSYDNPAEAFRPNGTTPSGGGGYPYPQSLYQGQEGYYSQMNGPSTHGQDPRYARSTTPGVSQPYGRQSSADSRYYSSSGLSPSSVSPPSPYYSSPPYSSSSSHHDRFIPTPSEMANTYNYSGSIPDQHPSQSPSAYSTPGHHSRQHRSTSTSPVLSSNRGTMRTSHASTTSPATERYPCEICGKTFSRSHDRKRHHETQHIASPVLHRCRYCRKEFSRADSLKRHLDNGCDEMPSNR